MKINDALKIMAEEISNSKGCTVAEAYGKLATACMALGGYTTAHIIEHEGIAVVAGPTEPVPPSEGEQR